MTGWRLSSTGLPASFGQGSGEEEFNGSVVIAAAQAADCRKSRRLWRGVDIFITVLLVRSVFRKHRGHRGAQSLLSLDSRDEHLQESIITISACKNWMLDSSRTFQFPRSPASWI